MPPRLGTADDGSLSGTTRLHTTAAIDTSIDLIIYISVARSSSRIEYLHLTTAAYLGFWKEAQGLSAEGQLS